MEAFDDYVRMGYTAETIGRIMGAEQKPNNTTRTVLTRSYPDDYNKKYVSITDMLWSDSGTYESLRELYATTGDHLYLDQMLDKVEMYDD
jgi:hypothetical protein